MYWDKDMLKTPMLAIPYKRKIDNSTLAYAEENKRWQECIKKGFPYIEFRKRRADGEYKYDCLTVGDRLELTEEGTHEIMGIFEACFARWYIDKRFPRSGSIPYHIGKVTGHIACVPLGEEEYIHMAVCRVFAKHLQPHNKGLLDDEEFCRVTERYVP